MKRHGGLEGVNKEWKTALSLYFFLSLFSLFCLSKWEILHAVDLDASVSKTNADALLKPASVVPHPKVVPALQARKSMLMMMIFNQ